VKLENGENVLVPLVNLEVVDNIFNIVTLSESEGSLFIERGDSSPPGLDKLRYSTTNGSE